MKMVKYLRKDIYFVRQNIVYTLLLRLLMNDDFIRRDIITFLSFEIEYCEIDSSLYSRQHFELLMIQYQTLKNIKNSL